jgi:hypothetical protein
VARCDAARDELACRRHEKPVDRLEGMRKTERWRIAKEDETGFASRSQRVERITWVSHADPVVVNAYPKD